MKFLFLPFSILSGLLAGFLGKKVFDGIWGAIDDEEPPDSKHLEISWGKLLLAAAVQGAIFRAVKEATDHGTQAGVHEPDGHLAGRRAPRARIALNIRLTQRASTTEARRRSTDIDFARAGGKGPMSGRRRGGRRSTKGCDR